MASTADRLLGEALKLTAEERARIVAELLATLEPDFYGQFLTTSVYERDGNGGDGWDKSTPAVQIHF